MFKILKKILPIFTVGATRPFNSSQSRITIFTNAMIFWGLIIIPALVSTLMENNVNFQIYGVPFLLIFVVCLLTYFFNSIKKYLIARVLAVILMNSIGYQAAILYGTSFNGYLIFFPAITYTVIALSREKKIIRWSLLIMTLLGLPIIDYLHINKMIPVTGLHSSSYGVQVLWVDTFMATIFCTIMLMIEKSFYDKYEDELKMLTEKLETIVEKRTFMLVKAKEEAIQASLLKSQFVANTSHELRTPIQGLIGFVAMAEKRLEKLQNLDEKNLEIKTKTLKSLAAAEKSSERLLSLVDALLKITRSENRGFQSRPQKLNIKNFLFDYIEALKSKGISRPIDLKISLNSEEASVDKTIILQVFDNLIENAQRYSKPGSVISVSLVDSGADLIFSVTNEGIGIPPGEEKKIFEPFVQSSWTDQSTGGTGLGLSICEKYAEAVNGSISLRDPSPEKTQFVFQFPKINS